MTVRGNIENPNVPRHLVRRYKVMHYQNLNETLTYLLLNIEQTSRLLNVSTYQQS